MEIPVENWNFLKLLKLVTIKITRSGPVIISSHKYPQINYKITTVLRGGRTQNVSYIFQGVFEGGLENVSLHVAGILKTLSTKTTPGGRSAANFTFKGGSQKMYLTFWYGPPWKVALKGVVML